MPKKLSFAPSVVGLLTPDGKKIVFISSYQAKGEYEFNIFTADWK